MLLVDERRLSCGYDPALASAASHGSQTVVTPAEFLERVTGLRTIADGERRAIVRCLARRDGMPLAADLTASPSLAARVCDVIDRDARNTIFTPLIAAYRTLTAFANVVDTREALRHALAGEQHPLDEPAKLFVDAILVDGDAGSFTWRRLLTNAGVAYETIDLGPVVAPLIDRGAVESIAAFWRYAQTHIDADARAALVSSLSPEPLDDARLLLAIAGERTNVLDVIDGGAGTMGNAFARALRRIERAYHLPGAGASTVLAETELALHIEHAPTAAALARIARDFDRARAFEPAWDAAAFIAEIDAEFAGAQPRGPGIVPSPAALAPPQAPSPVRTRPGRFSASALNAFAECERKWYYRYVCAAVEDRGSSASFYGIAFHAALEDFHTRYARVDAATETAALESFLDFCVVAAFDRHRTRFDAPVEFELQKRRARRTAKRYVEWLVERARAVPFTVIGNETATDVELGGFPFVGYIDRLDREDATGNVTVVDYKTGSIATSAAEYLADVLAFREFQLPFYYWARTAAGDRVTRLALIPLKDALLEVEPVELRVVDGATPPSRDRDATVGTIGTDDLARARTTMMRIAERLSAASIETYPVTSDAEACRYCAYTDACRDRPVTAEERFGR